MKVEAYLRDYEQYEKEKNREETDPGGLNKIGHIREGLVQVGRIVWE